MKEFCITRDPLQTKKLGKQSAKKILKSKKRKNAFIIALKGELGGGKTTFLQGFAGGLGIKEKILSPTFVIIKKFTIKNKTQHPTPNTYYHIDCYRIKKSKEILDLGFKEIISNPQNIVAIEWADKIKKILPKSVFWIKFKFINEKTREIVLSSNFPFPA